MPLFEEADIKTLKAYKVTIKKALAAVKKDEVPFIYVEKYPFEEKKTSLLVIDKLKIDPKFAKAIKDTAKAVPAEGTCYHTEDGELVLEVAKGKINPSSFAVDGIDKVVVRDGTDKKTFREDEALGSNTDFGDNKIDLDQSKLDQFQDVLARQQKKLDAALLRIAEIQKEQKKLAETLQLLNANKPGSTSTQKETELFKESVKAATDLKLKLSAELSEQTKIKTLADGAIKAAAGASTDEDKAKAVFSLDRFGKAIDDLEGTAYQSMMQTNDAVMVLGRTSDTWKLQLTDEQQGRTLQVDPALYTLTANDAFMKGGINIKARFQLVTDFTEGTVKFLKNQRLTSKQFLEYVEQQKDAEPALWDKNGNRPAVSAREVGQLFDDGYWFGVYDDKGARVQMMFPRALKSETLDEINKLRKD